MDINQFRQQYPQYDALDDEEIVERLHAKFHPNEDLNAFRTKFLGRPSVEEQKASGAIYSPSTTPEPSPDAVPVTPTAPAPETGAVTPVPVAPAEDDGFKLASLGFGPMAMAAGQAPPNGKWGKVFSTAPGLAANSGEGMLTGDRLETLDKELEAAKNGKAFDPTLESGAIRDPMALARAYEELDKRQPRPIAEIEADIADAMREEDARLKKGQELAKPLEGATLLQRGVSQALTSAPMSGAALVAGIATRSPTMAAMSMYPLTQKESYARLRAKGLSHESAKIHSRVQGVTESATEMIPFHVLLGKIPGMKKLLGTILAEEGGETLAQLVQGTSDYVAAEQANGKEITSQMLFDGLVDASKQLPETWVATAIGSAAQTGAVQLADRALNGKPDEKDVDLIRRANEAYMQTLADSMAELSQQKIPQSMQRAEAERRAQEAALEVIAERSPVQAAQIRLDKLERDAKAGKTVDPAKLQEAREALETATVESARARLRSGELTPEQQQEAARALQDMDTAPEEGAGTVTGEIRPTAPGKGQQPAEGKKPGVPTAKAAAPLSEVETGRQDALNRVANADSIEEGALNDLIAGGLAKINPQTQRPVLLPPGKRQRTELNKRAEAAELAEKEAAKPEPVQKPAASTEREQAPKVDKPTPVAKKPQRKAPQKPTAVALDQQAKPPRKKPPGPPGPPPAGAKILKEAPAAPVDAVATLNIGHKVGNETKLTPERVRAALEKRGVQLVSEEVHEAEGADDERTSIIQLDRALTPEEANEVSIELEQESIAQRVGNKGELYGPSAEKWRPFDPARFKEPGKGKVAVQKSVVAQEQEDDYVDDRDAPEGEFKPSKPIETEPMDEPAFSVPGANRPASEGYALRKQADALRAEAAAIEQGDLKFLRRTLSALPEDAPKTRARYTRAIKKLEKSERLRKQADEILSPAATQERAQNPLPEEPAFSVSAARDERGPPPPVRPRGDVPKGFYQDNPGLRGDERGAQWLRNKQRYAEEDMATAKKRGTTTGSMARGIGGSVTAQVSDMDLPTDVVAQIPGTNGEQREPGEHQFDRLMENVRKEGFNQEKSPILIMVNHKGQAFIHEGNTRTAVAKAIGAPTVRAEIRWWNGGETADGPLTPAKVRAMTEPDAAFAAAEQADLSKPAPGWTIEKKAGPSFGKEGYYWAASPDPRDSRLFSLDDYDKAVQYTHDNPPLLAPNGKPTKLTRAQWHQVRTPEFKAWFGDWEEFALQPGNVWNDSEGKVSKVVDRETGEPLVVFHGTDKGGFRTFNNEVAPNTSAPAGTAFFTNDAQMATTYSNTAEEIDLGDWMPEGIYVHQSTYDDTWYVTDVAEPDPDSDQSTPMISWGFQTRDDAVKEARLIAGNGGRQRGLYPVFLNIRDPEETDFEGANWDGSRDHQYMVIPASADKFDLDSEEVQVAADGTKYFSDLEDAERLANRLNSDAGAEDEAFVVERAGSYVIEESTNHVVARAKAMRTNDGVILREVIDEGQYYTRSSGEPADVFVAYDPNQIKHATQNRGTFDPKNDDITFAAESMFYSALTRAGENAKMTKGSAAQWYGALKNTPGVKQEELDWSGVKEWLGDRKSVTKDEVTEYLRANELRVDEQVWAAPKYTINPDSKYALPEVIRALDLDGEGHGRSLASLSITIDNDRDAYMALHKAFPGLMEERDEFTPHWSHEVVADLVLVDGEKTSPKAVRQYQSNEHVKRTKSGKYAQYQLPGGENYRMMLIQLPDPTPRAAFRGARIVEQGESGTYYVYDNAGAVIGRGDTPEAARAHAKQMDPNAIIADTFYSSHFPDDRNVMAHVRMNDRTDTNGRRFVFVETFQSDWHQAGRKHGYASDLPAEGLPKNYEVVEKTVTRKDAGVGEYETQVYEVRRSEGSKVRVPGTFRDYLFENRETAIEAARGDYLLYGARVPDAPFKTTWPEMVMKRLVRYAAENGYDGIGWTTGEQQAERWGDELEDGMSGFYDEILPHAASKVGKKYGAKSAAVRYGDPGTSETDERNWTPAFRAHGMLLTPELKTAALQGQPLFATGGGTGRPVSVIKNEIAEAERLLGVRAVVVKTADELPRNTGAQARARGIRPAGLYDHTDGTIYLVAGNIDTPGKALEFYLHEAVGHYGLRAFLGERYDAVMDQIIANFREEVLRAQKRNGIGRYNGKLNPFNQLTLVQQRLAAEESVAYAAQALTAKTGGRDERTLWRKMVDYVRTELMKHGLLKNMKPSDIDALIFRARAAAIRRARTAAYEQKVAEAKAQGTPMPKVAPVNDGALLGMPTRTHLPGRGEVVMGPHRPAREAAARYKAKHGIKTPEVRTYVRVNPATGKRVADAYQHMKHDPTNPRVKAAYDAMIRETLAQYQEIKKTGLKVEFIQKGQDPYKDSPRLAIEDVKNNNHLWVFPTETGFSMDAAGDYMKNNPLLAPTDEYVGQHRLLANDVFRIVHDYFGHIQEGNGFRHDGEENAWRIHASMYSPLARAAMTSETRGQNSWLNWGPHGAKNRSAKNEETVYAEQKIGLLPPEFWNPEPEADPRFAASLPPLPGRYARVQTTNGPRYMRVTKETDGRLVGYRVTKEGDRWGKFLPGNIEQQEMIVVREADVLEELEMDRYFGELVPRRESPFAVSDEVAATIHKIARDLTPSERAVLNRATAQKLVDKFESLRDVKEYAAVAKAGAAKRGWYRDAAEMISNVFGPDAPRFAALLGALSPRTNVADNLKNAAQVFAGWERAGRPTDRKSIVKIMGKNLWGAVDRDGKRVNVLPAWINNTVRALATADASEIMLSGPKADSFMRNLRGEVDAVTLDSWMAAFELLEQSVLQGVATKSGPGKRFTYLALSAKIRETARYLTKTTGEVWTPAEVQETIWSWTKTLTELAAEYGSLSSAVELVRNGELTDELINGTADFATLFARDEHVGALRALGYGDRIDRAVGKQAAQRASRRQASEVSPADQRRLVTAAGRIDQRLAAQPQAGVSGAQDFDIPFATVDEDQQQAYSVLGGNTGDPDIDEFMAGIGGSKRTVGQWFSDATENLGARAQMAIFDDLYGIKRAGDIAGVSASDVGFKNAHFAKNAAELTQATLEFGAPVWHRDGNHMVAGVEEGGRGFIDIVRPLGEKINLWAAWMVARRADRLMGEGRERHFKQAGIDKVKMLHLQHPEFEVVAQEYAAFQKKVLDFAQEAGIIDPETRAVWENADYIPFYRIIENGLVSGPNGGGMLGKVRNQIRKLKGGKGNIGDPLENIARNWYSLLDASLKAHAARTVVDALDGSGLVTRAANVEITQALVPRSQIEKFIKSNPALVQHLQDAGVDLNRLPVAAFNGIQKMLAVQAPSGEDIISVWRNGKREYWHVHDDLLFESLMNVNRQAFGPLMEFFRYPKRLGTAFITSTPDFGIKNFLRDMMHSAIQGSTDAKTTLIPGYDSLKGAASQLRQDQSTRDLLAGGGSFTHGYIRGGGDMKGAAATIRRSLKKASVSSTILDTPGKLWGFYRDLLNASENAHRVAIYNKMRKKGASRLDAMYEARDLLDFGKRGNNLLVRILTETVMFLNARAQGLYRLGRGFTAADTMAQRTGLLAAHMGRAALSIFLRGSIYMTLMFGLWWTQKDDPRYEALTPMDKANYIHFFDVFGEGDHWKLPVPFEVGTLFGTVPIAIADAIHSDEPTAAKDAAHQIGYAFQQTLNMSPDIQLLQPILELAMNKDTFTEAPILTLGDQAVLPEEQDDPRLSPTVRAVAKSMPDAAPDALRSPKQLNHLVRNYTGAGLDYGLYVTDAIVRRLAGEPPPADKRLRDYPFLRSFNSTGPARLTKYQTTMFEVAEEAEKVAASIRKLEKSGTDAAFERIDELEADNAGLLNARPDFKKAAEQVVDIRRIMREVQLDASMSPEQKRAELDALQEDINDIAFSVWDVRPGGKLNPEVAVELIDEDLQGRIDTLLKNKMPETAKALGELE